MFFSLRKRFYAELEKIYTFIFFKKIRLSWFGSLKQCITFQLISYLYLPNPSRHTTLFQRCKTFIEFI